MDSNQTFEAFTALRLHFSTASYDYFKYEGRMKYPLKSVNTRNDKFQIAKVAKHKDPIGLMIANFIKNPQLRWVGDLITDDAFRTFTEWTKRREAITYTFTQDLKKLDKPLASNFKLPDNDGIHPLALRLYLGDHICLETLVILNSLIGFYSYWDKKLQDDPVWKSIRLAIPKYTPFVIGGENQLSLFGWDREKYKAIVKAGSL